MLATVLTGRNNIFTVQAGEQILLCRLKGKTLSLDERSYNPLAPGDEVQLESVDAGNKTAVITGRAPRKNAFARFNRKRDALQTLAANVDRAVVVMSIGDPVFRERFVDRMLVLGCHHDVPVSLVITKSELDPDLARRTASVYDQLGVRSICCSAVTIDGMATVRGMISGNRSVLVGQSGVGKSTLLNYLMESDVQETGSTDRFNRGRHTTNAGLLVRTSEFELVDTPGVRELDCTHVPRESLDRCFVEFVRHRESCSMRDCSHRNEPGCAVIAAVERGEITRDRYASYVRLYEELEAAQETP